ncbi:MAG: 23S rRNA (uracil-5-)-methyltransferase RumA [Candidatus Woesearchaeota archaeon]|jgi:23S rRNA (uracil-5-)-methyltransferase RumA
MTCPYFSKCGGCSLQHISYDQQLLHKKENLEKLFPGFDIQTHSDTEYGYRNRMDLIFHTDGIGFRKKGDYKKIINIDQCPISNSRLNEIITQVRSHFTEPDAFDIQKKTGTFRFAVIRTPSTGASVSFVLNQDSTRIDDATKRIEEFATKSNVENIVVTYVRANTEMTISSEYYVVKGSDMLCELILDKKLSYSVQGFFQNNSTMAQKMVAYTKEIFGKYTTQDKLLLDLYGGVGTFGICLADMFKSVHIVEDFAQSIEAAKKNISDNNIANAKATVCDAKSIQKLKINEPCFVLLDPPRSGMHKKAISQVCLLEPEVIIYVSCNPEQFAKEISQFAAQEYKLQSIALFDLFPQTPHMETISVFYRTKSTN